MDIFTIGVIIGWLLIASGIAIFLIAAVAMLFRSIKGKARGFRGGGIIMLGPIPIILGTDKETIKTLMVMAILLIAVALTFFIVILTIL